MPLTGSESETVGPFTLFRPTSALSYYGRPTPGLSSAIDPADVTRFGHRCDELGLPRALEWVVEIAPSASSACVNAGWDVVEHPLLALEPSQIAPVVSPPGVTVRRLRADRSDLRQAWATVQIAFAHGRSDTGTAGTAALEAENARVDSDLISTFEQRTARGETVTAAAYDDGGRPLAVGQHQPVGSTTEVVAVGTLPAHRRQGLAAAVITTLVQDAAERGVDLVLLSAAGDDSARLYERLGFRRIGSVGAAEDTRPRAVPPRSADAGSPPR